MIFSSSLLLTHLSYRPALFKASKKNLIYLLKARKNFSNAANRSMDVMQRCIHTVYPEYKRVHILLAVQ